MRFLKHRLVTSCVVAVLLVFFGACLSVVFDGLRDNLHTADLAVVLGNKVRPDGQPSPALKARLDHTVDLCRQGYFKLILVSGAHGKEGYDEPRVMKRYLVANGLPGEAIFEDNGGYNSWQTARNTARFMKEHELKSVLIISQYFHLPRCRLAFSKFGLQTIYTSHARYWSIRDFYSVPRDAIGYAVYYFRDPNENDSPTISD